jgi:hypothetical protein
VIGRVQGSKYSSRGLSPEESAIDENEAARGMRSERADGEQRNVALLNEKESAFAHASTRGLPCLIIRGPPYAELYLVQRMKSHPMLAPASAAYMRGP